MDDYGSGSYVALLVDYMIQNRLDTQDQIVFIIPYSVEYYSYLKSDEWKEKSYAAKERAGWKCQFKSSHSNKVLHTHHRTYERLGHELDSDLIVLCDKCHKKFHDLE